MKKKFTSETVMLVSGVVFALVLSFVWLTSYVKPYPITIRTVAEANTLWWQALPGFDFKVWNTFWNQAGIVITSTPLLIYCVSLVRSMNKDFNLRKLKTLWGILLWPLAVGGVFVSLGVPSNVELFHSTDDFTLELWTNAIPIVGLGLAWLVSGAGQSIKPSWKGHVINTLTGAAVGLGIPVIHYMYKIAMNIIGIAFYVSHGRPYENNPYELKVIFGFAFLEILMMLMWVAGMAMAFSFRGFQFKTKIRWAEVSIFTFLVFPLFVGIIYLDNHNEYNELNRPLAAVTGISTEKQPPHALVLLINSSGKTLEWPTEFPFSNPFRTDVDSEYGMEISALEMYPATPDNMKKLSDHISRSNGGYVLSLYELALMKGYRALWDEKSAQETIVRYSRDFVLIRAQALGMFNSMPISQENRSLLIRIEEEANWNKDAITARDFCKMYKYMDMGEEGEKWCAIVRESMQWEPEIYIRFVNGTIRGNIALDGVPLSNAKIVLLYAYESAETIWEKKYMSNSSELLKSLTFPELIATVETGPHGEFEFTGLKDLGDKGYELTVVFDAPLAYEIAGIDNPPGLINVTSAENFFDLGTININIKQ